MEKEEVGSTYMKIKFFLIFYILGFGPNWFLPSALFQQIPWFVRTQPEGK